VRLSAGAQALVEGLRHGVVADGDRRRVVKRLAHVVAPAPDGAVALAIAALVRERGDPNEGGDLSAVQTPELGQLGKHRGCHDEADAGHGGEALVEALGVVLGLDVRLDLAFQKLALAAQGLDGCCGTLHDIARRVLLDLGRAGGDFLIDLRAIGDQITQLLAVIVSQDRRRRLHVLAESRQYRGIDLVRLGELAGSLGELAHTGRIDDGCWHALGFEGPQDWALEPARGFQDDASHVLGLETARQRFAAVGVVAHPNRSSGHAPDIQMLLADIHTNPRA